MWSERQEDVAVQFELKQPGKHCFYPKCGHHLMYSFMNIDSWLFFCNTMRLMYIQSQAKRVGATYSAKQW